MISVQDTLAELGVEYQAKSKYTAVCPKCSSTRQKSQQRCLMVHLDNDNSVNLKCYHSADCEYGKGYRIAELSNNDSIEVCEFNATPTYGEHPPVDATSWHTYVDDFHNDIMVIQRQDTVDENGNKKKFIFPWIRNEHGDWFRNRPTNVKKFLYNEDLLTQFPDKSVLVVEGELKADLAQGYLEDFVTVTWPFGANNLKEGKWELLKDRKVYLWPDNDKPGYKAMEEISKLIDTRELYLVNPRILGEGEDIGDIIKLGASDCREFINKFLKNAEYIGKPLLEGIVSLDDWSDMFKDTLTGYSFGYKEMDKYITYPFSGLLVIAGRVGHGKSALMVNLAANLLRNTDAVVIVGTYEVISRIWLGRLLQVLDGRKKEMIDKDNYVWYDKRLEESRADDVQVQEIKKYIKDKRLILADKQNDAKKVLECMQEMSKQPRKVFTFIDYIQKLPEGIFDTGKRHLTIEKMMINFTNLANELKQVVVAGSQLTEADNPYQDHMKESRAIKESAEMVFQIFNKNDKKAKKRDGQGEEKGDYYDWVNGDFVVNVDKTRMGSQYYFGFTFANSTKLVEAVNNNFN